MFCNKCGTQLANGAMFCPNCGSKQNAQPQQPPVQPQQPYAQPQQQYAPPPPPQQPQYAPPQQQYAQPQYAQPQPQYAQPQYAQPQSETPHNGNVSFGKAIELFFKNYANFKGRASKSEYWWAFLFNFLVSLVAGWIPVVGWLVTLALLVPGIAICVRRLHDVGRAGTYYFMGLIPIAGFIILIIEFCKDSVGDNEWGKGPQPVMYNNFNQPPYNYQ